MKDTIGAHMAKAMRLSRDAEDMAFRAAELAYDPKEEQARERVRGEWRRVPALWRP